MISSVFRRLIVGFTVAALGIGAVEAAPSNKPKTTTKRSTTQKKTTASRKTQQQVKTEPVWRPVVGKEPPQTAAASVMLVDALTGRVLYEKNADERRAPASTQKLLTALIVAEEGNLDKKVTFQPVDLQTEPVMLYAKPGDTYTRRQLLEALLVKSFNDVARALARDNAGSVEAFAVKMNRKAAELGMTSSHFVNPNGLTEPNQYSTARDMAKLALVAYHNPTLRQIFSIKELPFRYANGRVTTFKNTNRVLRGWAPCNGMKTGYTMAAGHCLVSSASLNGRDVIAVVLGDNRQHIWHDSASLLAWGLMR